MKDAPRTPLPAAAVRGLASAPARLRAVRRRVGTPALMAGVALGGCALGFLVPGHGPELILGLLAVGFVLLGFSRPLDFVYLAIASAPLANVLIVKVPGVIQIRISVFLWWLCGLAVLAFFLFGRRKVVLSPATLALGAYGALLLSGVLWAGRPVLALKESIQFFTYILIFVVVDNTFRRPEELRKALYTFIVPATVLTVGYFVSALARPIMPFIDLTPAGFRFAWTEGYFHPVTIVTIAGVVTVLCIAFLFAGRESKAQRFMLAAIAVLALVVQGLTLKRIELMALVVGGAVLFSFYDWKRGLFYGTLAAAFTLGTFVALPDVRKRFEAVEDLEERAKWHYALPVAGLNMWKESPILGKGAGAYSPLAPEYLDALGLFSFNVNAGEERDPHNIVIKVLSESGLVGLALFGLFLGIVLWRVWRACRTRGREPTFLTHLTRGLFAAMLVELVVAMAQNPQNSNQFWLILALGYSAARMREKWDVPAPAPAAVRSLPTRRPAPRRREPTPALRMSRRPGA